MENTQWTVLECLVAAAKVRERKAEKEAAATARMRRDQHKELVNRLATEKQKEQKHAVCIGAK